MRGARRVLCLGIGGGGDVVGALAAAEWASARGVPAIVGGLTWERSVIDPLPGPRTLDEVTGARRLNDVVALAGPDAAGPGGFAFAEGRMARVLGEETVLVAPHGGPRTIAAGLDDACAQLGCDRVVLLDVGGDVLGHGHEANLASPLADAVLLAASAFLQTPAIAALVGAGCDGELTLDEVMERLAEVAAAGGVLGAWGLTPVTVDRMEAAIADVPTEASAMAVHAARGRTGRVPIRRGRRSVVLSPVCAILFLLDPAIAMATAARLTGLVRDATSLEDADRRLGDAGVRTELAYERSLLT